MGTCPDLVKRLIDRFNQQADQVRSPDYNETQLRIDFINPLFAQLGWDMDNTQGFAEQYREVVHEDRVKVAGATKAPDYSFRIGGVRKFFLEAKKPFVNIKQAWEPAYQLRRYAWSAKLAVSVLTDFEELAIYDCRVKPTQMEKPSTARREFIAYADYPQRWDFLDGTLSKRAILTGDFDRYSATKKGRGAQEFDEAFLEEIEDWRKKLASNLALRNEHLTEHDLNFATQRIIDRIMFLRICEDRGVEPTGHLQQLLSGDNTYRRLVTLFREADARYNSGLFHFRKESGRDEAPDELTLALEVDDDKLKSILRHLYYPESPYEFTMVSADILGSVYERFLGKVITLTAGHHAKIEEKPEVRKAGGVYYTPTYIVDYIVKQTVGKLLGDVAAPVAATPASPPLPDTKTGDAGVAATVTPKDPVAATPASPPLPDTKTGDAGVAATVTPKDAAKLKILDPACGSGSFLLGAYQYLLDWHLKWYVADGPEKHSKGKNATIRPADKPTFAAPAQNAGAIRPLPPGEGRGEGAFDKQLANQLGHWALTTRERKRILLDNIHGVDIDYQAVEVTKLSLLLRCLEGETAESLRGFMTLFRERALPDLGRNIQCGNSLIGTDIMTTDAWREMSEDERRRINPFDYERVFPQVFRQGGFDAVIGNPPYIRVQRIADEEAKYLYSRFRSATSKVDLSTLFLERAIGLLRTTGLSAMISTTQWLSTKYGANLREMLSDGRIHHIVDFGSLTVFKAADTYPGIFVVGAAARESVALAKVTDKQQLSIGGLASLNVTQVPLANLRGSSWNLGGFDLLDALSSKGIQVEPLRTFGKAYIGTKSGLNEAFVLTAREARAEKLETELLVPYACKGEEVRRFDEAVPSNVIIYPYREKEDGDLELLKETELASRYPRVLAHLRHLKQALQARKDSRRLYATGLDWYRHLRAGSFSHIRPDKIVFKGIALAPCAGMLRGPSAFDGARCPCVILDAGGRGDLAFFLGLLNSQLATSFFHRTCPPKLSGYIEFSAAAISSFPIVRVSSKDRQRVVILVDEMLSLHATEAAATHPQEKEQFRRRIEATDRQIDELVYQLYGLTNQEIKIVEEATTKRQG